VIGATKYMTKPFVGEELLAEIEKCFRLDQPLL
jgi:DNA-binding response OmpR family regulator